MFDTSAKEERRETREQNDCSMADLQKHMTPNHKTQQRASVTLYCVGIGKPSTWGFLALNEQFKCEPNSRYAVPFTSVGVFIFLNLSIC